MPRFCVVAFIRNSRKGQTTAVEAQSVTAVGGERGEGAGWNGLGGLSEVPETRPVRMMAAGKAH